MNAFDRMNQVVDYIESNITGDIDYAKAAAIACCPKSQFQRFFSYIAEIPLSEYVRRRRLTLCAFELQENKLGVLEVAAKYGYDSHASFARAFKGYHGISPTQARDKGAVVNICPRLTFVPQDVSRERGSGKKAVLGRLEFIELPAVRMIGIPVINGGGENPVPELWKKCFAEGTFRALEIRKAVVPYSVGWMGEYDAATGKFTYIAGYMMPAGAPVPEGFGHRDLSPCTIGNGYINGSFANGDVFAHSHELTVGGITQNGYEPDYSYGWSAEAYANDLAFEAEEGTVNYFCPCRKTQ